MITVAVIDDHPLIRDGIRGWCERAEPSMSVIAEYAEPQSFRDSRIATDVLVLDLQFRNRPPDMASVEELSRSKTKVVVYSHHTGPDTVLDCLELGAFAYVSKEDSENELITALRATADDQPYTNPTMAKAMHTGRSHIKPKLSPRELEILVFWFQTESKAMVAKQLYLSVGTIDTYLARIRTKYAAVGRPAPTKAALVARAIKDGLITPDEL